MFKINKSYLNANNIYRIHPTCSFCKHKLLNSSDLRFNNCLKFYAEKLEEGFCGTATCPYGFSTYFTDNSLDFLLTGFALEGESDFKKLRKIINDGYFLKSITHQKNDISDLVNQYGRYKEYHECCAQLQHDIGNAVQYLYSIVMILQQKELGEKINELFKGYDCVAEQIRFICNGSLKPFDFSTNWEDEIMIFSSNIKMLERTISLYSELSFPLKDKYNCKEESERDLYCAVNGFLLIRSIFYKDLGTFSLKQQQFDTLGYYKPYDIVLKMVNLLRYKAEEKQVKFSPFQGKNIIKIHNNECFSIAIFTLLDNAIKYCTEPKRINVAFRDEHDGHVTICISNPSDYLSEEDIANITKKGYRGSNKSKTGNGLGLYIVEKIIKKCSSSIEFKYENGIFYSEIELIQKY